MENRGIKLGTFRVTEDRLHISDPSYEYESGYVLENVLPGDYIASIDIMDDRVAFLRIIHKDYQGNFYEYELETSDIGVDSGQAGIFNDFYYKENEGGEFENYDTFYGKCCEITLSSDMAGIVDNQGVVASSGYGDGVYRLYVGKENDKIVFVCIDFSVDEEEI